MDRMRCVEVVGTCLDVLLMKGHKESGRNGIKSRESDCGVFLFKRIDRVKRVGGMKKEG